MQTFYLTRFSSPAENRSVYQAVCRVKPKTILEFGVQRGLRSDKILELAGCYRDGSEIQYCCVDPFESRSQEDGPGLSLRKAYKVLAKSGARIQTIPDLPEDSLRHVAASVRDVELLVVATPSIDWVFECRDALVSLLSEKAIIFVGQSTVSGKPFEFVQYSTKQFAERQVGPAERTEHNIRRAA